MLPTIGIIPYIQNYIGLTYRIPIVLLYLFTVCTGVCITRNFSEPQKSVVYNSASTKMYLYARPIFMYSLIYS